MDYQEYPMQAVAPTVAAILDLPAPAASEAPPIPPVVDDLKGTTKMAVLAVDALGLFIRRHWRERMPFLTSLLRERSAALRSIQPSVTPVNFGCMVTGASLEVHGARTRDTAFECETLFDVLRAAGRTSAGLGRAGWTGSNLLGRFADLSADEAKTDADVETVLHTILEEQQADFVIVQFGLTDETFHAHGPYSTEAGDAAAEAEARLARAVPVCRAHDYGVLILADHGQHPVDAEDGQRRGVHGTEADEDSLVPLTWTH